MLLVLPENKIDLCTKYSCFIFSWFYLVCGVTNTNKKVLFLIQSRWYSLPGKEFYLRPMTVMTASYEKVKELSDKRFACNILMK